MDFAKKMNLTSLDHVFMYVGIITDIYVNKSTSLYNCV